MKNLITELSVFIIMVSSPVFSQAVKSVETPLNRHCNISIEDGIVTDFEMKKAVIIALNSYDAESQEPVSKKELALLEKLALLDSSLSMFEQDVFYQIGYKKQTSPENTKNPKISGLIRAGYMVTEGKLNEAVKMLRDLGLMETADKLEKPWKHYKDKRMDYDD